MRKITLVIKDIGKLRAETHGEICSLLKREGKPFDGVLVSSQTGKAYVWREFNTLFDGQEAA